MLPSIEIQQIPFQIHSSIRYVEIMMFILSFYLQSKFTMAQDSSCLYLIPLPPPLPNFIHIVHGYQDSRVASLKEGGTMDDTFAKIREKLEKNCDCNATKINIETVNFVRECPKTSSKNWSLDHSHCDSPKTTASITTSIRTTLVQSSTASVETTLTTSQFVTPPSGMETNVTFPGVGEVHTADADPNSIIIAATVIPIIIVLGLLAFILYKCKIRDWCAAIKLKHGKRPVQTFCGYEYSKCDILTMSTFYLDQNERCYQARESAPPPSQTGTNGKIPNLPTVGSENLGMETAESPVSIIPLENRFSTFGRPKSQAVSEYSASTSFEEQSPDHVPIRNGTNNNKKPRSLYLDLGQPGDDDIPYIDLTPSPGPTPTSPAAGFNAGFLRGISRVELI